MQWYDAVILGIVEGITEFLPISSTAHLLLAEKLLGIATTDFVKTFTIAIQLGAIVAVMVVYLQRLSLVRVVWRKVVAAFIPTAIVGFVLYKGIKQLLTPDSPVVFWALALGGLILIGFEFFAKNKKEQIDVNKELKTLSYPKALLIGLAQSLAVVPGVSRSAATIIAGRALGLSRQAVVEFSFLLAIPTIAAATLYDMYKNAAAFSNTEFDILTIGFAAAFVSAYFAIRWLLSFIKEHNFISFGFYRIVLVVIWLAFFF